MGMKCGIVGLPNVGKSTLFNALTAAGVAAENYPFCTTDPNVGSVPAPDERLAALSGLLKPERVVPAALDFVDIAGLVRGASQGEGMGNEFLDHIRNVDAIAHVVRCFADPLVTFHESVIGVDPSRDADIVEFELLQKDLAWTERRLEKASHLLRTGDKGFKHEVGLYERMIAWLNAENARAVINRVGRRPAGDGPAVAEADVLRGKPGGGGDRVGRATCPGRAPGPCAKEGPRGGDVFCPAGG